jgi:hypothetical protein
MPQLVLDEFARNKARVTKEGTQGISSAVRRVQEVLAHVENGKNRAKVANTLSDLGLKLPTLAEKVAATIERVERVLKDAPVIATSSATKARAAERALAGIAPFHRNKNSIGDAVLIETYADAVGVPRAKGVRFAFVTHNKHDFSMSNGDERKPHPDLAPLFSKIRSVYCITLADMLRRVDAELLTDEMLMQEWVEEPRSASEIVDAMDVLFDQVWYNRHQNLRFKIENGIIKEVEKETYPRPQGAGETIQRDVWVMAQKAAQRVAKRRGMENLGPWDDFEWGMLNGKLSALRWVLGDEWDMLDT